MAQLERQVVHDDDLATVQHFSFVLCRREGEHILKDFGVSGEDASVDFEQGRRVVLCAVERLDQRFQAMTAEIGHQIGERRIVVAREQFGDMRAITDVGGQP